MSCKKESGKWECEVLMGGRAAGSDESVLPVILARFFLLKKRQIPSALSAICCGQ